MREPLSVPPEFDALPVEDKIDFVQRLWARIAKDPESIPTPAWHIRVLEERLEAMERDDHRGRTWEEVRADLRSRLSEVHR